MANLKRRIPPPVQLLSFSSSFRQKSAKQECIPVEYVPSAAVAVTGGVSAQRWDVCQGWDVCPKGYLSGGVCPGGCLPRGVSAQGVSARHPPPWTE